MESGIIVAGGFFIAAVIATVVLSKIMNQKHVQQAEQDQRDIEKEVGERFFMGQYKSGMPNFQGSAPIVYCGVTDDFFIFRKGTQGVEISRILRTHVDKVTATHRDAKNSFVAITWRNERGEQHRTEFQFGDKNGRTQAEAAAENLKKWAVPQAAYTSTAERAAS